MGYFITMVDAGATREITKWKKACREQLREARRAAKENPTREAQENVNRENARRHLRWDVNDNFCDGDYWVTFTYAREYSPTEETAYFDYQKLMRGIRAIYRKSGIELKYISTVLEPGHRPHRHILLSKGAAIEDIQALWPYGRIGVKLLDSSGQYSALADYIFKHSDFEGRSGKRWYSSKNLSHPQPKVHEASAKAWRAEPMAPRGWAIDKTFEIERGINPITGAEYIRYGLIKIPKVEKCRSAAARGRAHDTMRI